MTVFHFPQPGERHNAALVLVPETVLFDLVLSVVNADANQTCPGCAACDRWYRAASYALDCLSPERQSVLHDFAQSVGVNIYEWPEPV